jgi:uncharacterized membrane protein
MTRSTWLIAVLVATIVVSAATVSSASAGGASCRPTVTTLPDLGYGGGASAIHGNTVVGFVFDASGAQIPAYWRDGRLTQIGGFSEGVALDINPSGEIVGNGDSFSAPWALVHGAVQFLPASGGFDYARRINAWGQIAGTIDNYAVRWDSYSSQPVNLQPAAGDSFSFAKGINDLGQVAGDTDSLDGTQRPAIWNLAGRIRVLASGFGTGAFGDLYAINDLGQSVGESFPSDFSTVRATRWSSAGAPTLIPLLPGTNASQGLELNELGWASGVAIVAFDPATGNDQGHHAFVWFGAGPALTLPVPGYSYADSESDAHYITNDGTAVGSAGPAGGPDAATVWTCVQAQAFVPGGSAPTSRHRPAPAPGRVTFGRLRDRKMP